MRKLNPQQIRRQVREHIRAGRKQAEILKLMRQSGFPQKYIDEVKRIYYAEKRDLDRIRTGRRSTELTMAERAMERKQTAKRNYTDIVIRGTAEKTSSGWKIGRKVIPQGKGTVRIAGGYFLDRATGMVYAKRQRNSKRRNVAQGFYDASGIFHPIRSSVDYDSSRGGDETGRTRKTRSAKAKKLKARAASTARHTSRVKAKSAVKSLAARRLAKTTSTGKRLKVRKRNPFDTSQKLSPLSDAELSAKYSDAKAEYKEMGGRKRAALQSLQQIEATVTKAWDQGRPPQSLLDSYKAAKAHYEAVYGYAAKLDDWIAKAATELKKRRTKRNPSVGSAVEKAVKKTIKVVGGTIRGAVKGAAKAVKNPRRKSRRRNDGARERREQFAGKSTGHKELYFPSGTPGGLSTLGPLKLICTEVGDLQPQSNGLYLAQDGREKLYIGSTQNKAMAEPNTNFKHVTRIEYQCRKPHLGEPQDVIWFHDFDAPLPRLRSDADGALHFEGGAYRIKREGIVG